MFEICFHAKCLLSISGCGHCKKAKPEYTGAAEKFKDDNKVSGTCLLGIIKLRAKLSHSLFPALTCLPISFNKIAKIDIY